MAIVVQQRHLRPALLHLLQCRSVDAAYLPTTRSMFSFRRSTHFILVFWRRQQCLISAHDEPVLNEHSGEK